MHTVASFDNQMYAEMFKDRLEAEGIRCCLADTEINALGYVPVGGVKVQVLDEDVERLQPILEKMGEIPGQRFFHSLKQDQECPACGSMKVQPRPFPLMLRILTLGFPMLFCNRRFTCQECGHQFCPIRGEYD